MHPKTCRNCTCYTPREGNTRPKCGCPKVTYGYRRGFPEGNELHVEYDEEWGMSPGPDFGCVHWEECDELGGVTSQVDLFTPEILL